MRLILLFSDDYKDIVFTESDIILGKGQAHLFKDSNLKYYDIDRIPIPEKFAYNFDNEFKIITDNFKSDFLKNVFNSNKIRFYLKCYLPVIKYINAIQHFIKEEQINEIVISDLVENNFYTPFYEAEGEVFIQNKLFYKSFDFIPFHIQNYCQSNKLKCTILRKHSSFSFFIRKFLRRYVFFSLKFVKHLLNKIKYKEKKRTIQYEFSKAQTSKPFFIITSRAHVQSEFIYEFIQLIKPNYFVLVSERQFAYGENIQFLKSEGIDQFLHEQDIFTFKIYIKTLLKVSKELFKKQENIIFDFNGYKFNLSDSSKELIISSYELYLYKYFMEISIPKLNIKNPIIVSLEMISEFPYIVNKIAKENDAKSIQLQTTLMPKISYPDFIYTDLLITNNKEIQNHLYDVNNLKKSAFLGSLKYGMNLLQPKIHKELKNVIYFSQPFEYDIQDIILNKLYSLSKEDKFKLYIKPHPRENLKMFEKYTDAVLIDKNLPIRKYLPEMDLAITRTSSVGMDFYVYNIPSIFCLFSELCQSLNINYIDHNYYGTCLTIEKMLEVLDNYPKLISNFEVNRKVMLEKNDFTYDHNYFVNTLLSKIN